ncbi:MAG: DUF4382 domain-containing protein [Halanaerobiales bacterium]
MKKYIILSVLIISALLFSACSSSVSDGISEGSGELVLFLADKPVNNVDKVLVTISEVQVKRTDTEWETINSFEENGGEQEFDLMQLRFDDTLLGQRSLPAGHYEQIRLIVAADENGIGNGKGHNAGKSRVIYEDGTSDDIFIPSGTQTGLKINHDFIIEDGVITRLVLDADVSKIMHRAGNSSKIILRPTAIDVIDKVISGNIEGRVLDENGNNIYDSIAEEYDVVVEAYQNGEVVKSTVAVAEEYTKDTNDDDSDITKPAGTFFLRGLLEGTYTLKAYVADVADGEVIEETTTYQPTTVENVNVAAEETTILDSTIKLQKTVSTGSIEGNIVADTDDDTTYEAITTSDVVVEVIQNSQVVATVTALPNEAETANYFQVNDLEEGSYNLNIYVTDNQGNMDESIYQSKQIDSVTVTAENTTSIENDIVLEKDN